MNETKFAKYIKKRNVSVNKLMIGTKSSKHTIDNWISGLRSPSKSKAILLAKVLRIKISTLDKIFPNATDKGKSVQKFYATIQEGEEKKEKRKANMILYKGKKKENFMKQFDRKFLDTAV